MTTHIDQVKKWVTSFRTRATLLDTLITTSSDKGTATTYISVIVSTFKINTNIRHMTMPYNGYCIEGSTK